MHPRNRGPILFGILAGVLTFGAAFAAAQDDIEWLDNYAAARSEAARTGKPIFLEFRCEP